jgi:hypothetical protein
VHGVDQRFELLDPPRLEEEVDRGSMDDNQARPSPGALGDCATPVDLPKHVAVFGEELR